MEIFEKLILSIKPYSQAVEEAKLIKKEFGLAPEDSEFESENLEDFDDGIPQEGLEKSIKKL